MQDLEFNTSAVLLKGGSLNGQLIMTNRNQNLSIMFQIVTIPTRFLDVIPDRGIIMSTQSKKIKVKIPAVSRNTLSLSNIKMQLVIHTSMNSQYNKKIMKQRCMTGWTQVQKTFQTFTLPVILANDIGFQGQQIIRNSRKSGNSNSSIKSSKNLDYIKRSIIKQSSMRKSREKLQSSYSPNKSDHHFDNKKLENEFQFIAYKNKRIQNRSPINSTNHLNVPGMNDNQIARLDIQQSNKHQNSYGGSNLQIEKNYNGEFILTNQNLSGMNQNKHSRKYSRSPLNVDIGYYPEDQNDPLGTIYSPTVTINSPMLKGVLSSEKLMSVQNKQYKVDYPYQDELQKQLQLKHKSKINEKSDQRGLQLLILAIIAGFFVALGSNIGKLFSS